MRYSCLK
jgi:hypothetical protein